MTDDFDGLRRYETLRSASPDRAGLRYIVAKGRLSYKRHGRSGHAWFVIDTQACGSVAHADTEERAQQEADRLNAGGQP